ncbi:MAG TPA: hypothetical protein VFQ60_02420 [Patescibacteria group bacterium]|nr:hypothetical protein [Patescibacteria group bacterium]
MPLPHIHDLISETWNDYKKHWNPSLPISAWFLAGPAIFLILTLIAQFFPSFYSAAIVIGSAVNFVFLLWTTVRLSVWLLAKDQGKEPPKNEKQFAGAVLLSFFWIAILDSLATLGGFILFVLPGIWLLILFKFWPYAFLEDGRGGIQALAASATLVKGRWWQTFWRIIIPEFLFFVLFTAVMAVLASFVGVVAGGAKLDLLLNETTTLNPLIYGIRAALEGIGQLIFVPLIILLEVKIFHYLKSTRS